MNIKKQTAEMKRTHSMQHYLKLLFLMGWAGLLPLFFCACESRGDINGIPYIPRVVVEGSIEHNAYPTVLLSISAPINGIQDTVSLLQHAIRSALVIVSDNEQDDTLYLQRNGNRLPPYEYRGRNIKGEAGKEYRLRIEYQGDTLTARTRIPAPVAIDSLWFVPRQPHDTIGHIGICFRNTSTDCYRLSTALFSRRDVFTPCLYGNIASNRYAPGESIKLELSKGPSIYPANDFSTVYNAHDTIRIKLSTMPYESHAYWNALQNEMLNGQNPIFPAYSNLPGNINGGVGIWSGYGSTQRIAVLHKLPFQHD